MKERIFAVARLARAALVAAVAVTAFGVGTAQATHNSGSGSSGGSSAGSSGAKELVIFDWNKPVPKSLGGFPRFVPPPQNGNWKSPVNYAEGTFYVRVQVKKQPKPQNMRIQFCMWQDNLSRENCSTHGNVKGTPGNVVTWSLPVSKMWKKNGKAIDYTRSRQGISAPIWNQKSPVSNYTGFNWGGENPDLWYPLDMRMTVVVVAKGATFSGWDKFIK